MANAMKRSATLTNTLAVKMNLSRFHSRARSRSCQALFSASASTSRSQYNYNLNQLQYRYLSTSTSTSPTSQPQSRVIIHNLPNDIKHVQLNRPDKLNALDLPMFQAIADAAKQIRSDPKVRAVILSGNGRAFCAGLDVMSILTPTFGNSDRHGNGSDNVDNGDNGGNGDNGWAKAKMETLLKRPSGYERKREHENEKESQLHNIDDGIHALYRKSKADAFGNLAQDIAFLWRNLPVPVIAVLDGCCFGGGLQLALGADVRYATSDCKLSGE